VWESFVEVMGGRIGVTDTSAPVPPVPPGETLRDVLAGILRKVGRSEGVSYDRFTNDQLMTLQQYNLFPNVSLVIFPDLMTVLRSRPGATPDDGYLDVINYRGPRQGPDAPRPPSTRCFRLVRIPASASSSTRTREHRTGAAGPSSDRLLSDDVVPGRVPHPQYAQKPRALAGHHTHGDQRGLSQSHSGGVRHHDQVARWADAKRSCPGDGVMNK
jgi:hypothetical protein